MTDRLVVAQYNVERATTEKVQAGESELLAAAATVVQKVDPDLLLVNELSNNAQQGWTDHHNADVFAEEYLAVPQGPDREAVTLPHRYAPRSNTGIPTGLDLDAAGLELEPGSRTYGNDCHGYGEYPGRYALALFSAHPLDREAIRTFRRFRWADLPDDKMPTDPAYDVAYGEAVRERLRLHSKTCADVPVATPLGTVHAIVGHPTPPVRDGPANRNGRRCHDEVRFLGEYVSGADYPVDDDGVAGGLPGGAPAVLMGDMNAAPGESYRGTVPPGSRKGEFHFDAASRHLLDHPRLVDPEPTSPEGIRRDNPTATRFADDWCRRSDYVLPTREFGVVDAGVFYPTADGDQSGHETADRASNHRLVWVELERS